MSEPARHERGRRHRCHLLPYFPLPPFGGLADTGARSIMVEVSRRMRCSGGGCTSSAPLWSAIGTRLGMVLNPDLFESRR